MIKLISFCFLVIILFVLKASFITNKDPIIYRQHVSIDGKKMVYEISEGDFDYDIKIDEILPHKMDYYINIAQNEVREQYKSAQGYKCDQITLRYIKIPFEGEKSTLFYEFIFRLKFDSKIFTKSEYVNQYYLKEIIVPVLLNGKIPALKVDNEK